MITKEMKAELIAKYGRSEGRYYDQSRISENEK